MGRLADFDNRVDDALGRLRGKRWADRLFYSASAIGDHGMLWVLLAGVRALRGPQHRKAATRAAIGVGVESLIVNIGIKSLFRRRRPRPADDFVHPHHLRIPLTSSFPSGHSTSAFTAATLLSDGDPAMAPVYFAAATVVAASRVYVKIHHASDVIAGIGVGLALGQIGRRLFPLESDRLRKG
ncbi:MAG TPA: phosphatase PAP2 family protein [Acidimicrobiales bacterium]|nr:phosphatase PAP2 family protein [Acidimicrobiales bacterium]